MEVAFNDKDAEATIPIGLRVAMSGESSATCEESTCYERESGGDGVAFIRAWQNSGEPGQPATGKPVAPQATEVTVEPTPTGTGTPCAPTAGQAFSNLVSTSSSCTVQVNAEHVRFAEGSGAPTINCGDASLFLNGVKLECPNTGELNGKTWTSRPVTVEPNSGLKTQTLEWQLTNGRIPSGATGGKRSKCTENNPCKATLAVQRINSGAYDSQTEQTSKSGPIIGATVTEAGNQGRDIMSIKRGETRKVNITVVVLGFQNSTSIESPPVELSFGGPQANAALECGGNAGKPEFEKALAEGCANVYATTSEPNPPICGHQPEGPAVCAKENPGNGKLGHTLASGMEKRIDEGENRCVNPNHWVKPNNVSEVVSANDPRLIDLIITDYGALGNGTNGVPVRAFARFYVTGWAGDPCSEKNLGKKAPKDPGSLAYTYDEEPEEEGVLVGHFVKYVNNSPYATGAGECHETTFGDCVAVLTR